MEIFLVSFLVFSSVALLLVLSQRARGGELPVGCTPESGTCCLQQACCLQKARCEQRGFGNCIEPAAPESGSVKQQSV